MVIIVIMAILLVIMVVMCASTVFGMGGGGLENPLPNGNPRHPLKTNMANATTIFSRWALIQRGSGFSMRGGRGGERITCQSEEKHGSTPQSNDFNIF